MCLGSQNGSLLTATEGLLTLSRLPILHRQIWETEQEKKPGREETEAAIDPRRWTRLFIFAQIRQGWWEFTSFSDAVQIWMLHQRSKSPWNFKLLRWGLSIFQSTETAISKEAWNHWEHFFPNYFLDGISPLLINLDQINMRPVLTLFDTFI